MPLDDDTTTPPPAAAPPPVDAPPPATSQAAASSAGVSVADLAALEAATNARLAAIEKRVGKPTPTDDTDELEDEPAGRGGLWLGVAVLVVALFLAARKKGLTP